jgi:hypothetical protein
MGISPRMARTYLEYAREEGYLVREVGLGRTGFNAYFYEVTDVGHLWLDDYSEVE